MRILLETMNQVQTIHIGQLHIHKDHIRLALGSQLDCLSACTGDDGLMSINLDTLLQYLKGVDLIIYE